MTGIAWCVVFFCFFHLLRNVIRLGKYWDKIFPNNLHIKHDEYLVFSLRFKCPSSFKEVIMQYADSTMMHKQTHYSQF